MKKIILLFCAVIFVLTLAFIIALPAEKTSFKQLSAANITVSVPAYLTETKGIDSTALIQLMNEKKQLFVLVYETSDTFGLKESFNRASDVLVARLDNGNLLNYYPDSVNGIEAVLGYIRGYVNETGVTYKLMLLGPSGMRYKIIIGASENKKGDLREDIEQISSSIRMGK